MVAVSASAMRRGWGPWSFTPVIGNLGAASSGLVSRSVPFDTAPESPFVVTLVRAHEKILFLGQSAILARTF
jgi:hypothetical protein